MATNSNHGCVGTPMAPVSGPLAWPGVIENWCSMAHTTWPPWSGVGLFHHFTFKPAQAPPGCLYTSFFLPSHLVTPLSVCVSAAVDLVGASSSLHHCTSRSSSYLISTLDTPSTPLTPLLPSTVPGTPFSLLGLDQPVTKRKPMVTAPEQRCSALSLFSHPFFSHSTRPNGFLLLFSKRRSPCAVSTTLLHAFPFAPFLSFGSAFAPLTPPPTFVTCVQERTLNQV